MDVLSGVCRDGLALRKKLQYWESMLSAQPYATLKLGFSPYTCFSEADTGSNNSSCDKGHLPPFIPKKLNYALPLSA